MHPLLSPTSHADLHTLAMELTQSGYYDGHDAYVKMFMGITLGLTALESLHGVTMVGNKVIIEPWQLLERAVTRAGYVYKSVTSDTHITIEFHKGGRLVDSYVIPKEKAPESPVVFAQACRKCLSDVFGHKFYLRAELTPASVPAQPVALVAPAEKKSYTKKEQAENAQALLKWQNEVDTLSPVEPGEWDAHALKLKTLTFLPEAEIKNLWKKYKLAAECVGVGYDPERLHFFIPERITDEV